NRGVLSCFNYLIKIADATFPDRPGQRPILPVGAIGTDQVATHQIRSGEIIMTSDGIDRTPQLLGHVTHETGFTASCRAFDQYWKTVVGRRTEQLYFIACWLVKRH